MSTIGERMAKVQERKKPVESKWRDRADMVKAAGCIVLVIAVLLGTAFALIYLVTLAVRLAWGAT